jgi:putrescine---pyruvate transaminase
MLCVENVADRETGETLPDEGNVGKRISNHCEARGLIVRPIGHLNVMSPPLIMTRPQIDELIAILRESIGVTADELTREGHRLV